MNDFTSKSWVPMLTILWIIALISGGISWPGYAQTDLQELQNRVAELEKKLADAKARQEKAYSVQMKLEEQEQKLASLAEPNKYKVQIIEIRADIKNVRIRIEAITKEKNDLEENLRLARNLQTILSEARTIAKPEAKARLAPIQEKSSTQAERVVAVKPSIKPAIADTEPKSSWLIENIQISNHFTDSERSEISDNFSSGRQINQDDLLKSAYKIYSRIGISLHLVVHPKDGNTANLEILLGNRTVFNNNPGAATQFPRPITIDQFKTEYFNFKVEND